MPVDESCEPAIGWARPEACAEVSKGRDGLEEGHTATGLHKGAAQGAPASVSRTRSALGCSATAEAVSHSES
jgi:hypothetical protein